MSTPSENINENNNYPDDCSKEINPLKGIIVPLAQMLSNSNTFLAHSIISRSFYSKKHGEHPNSDIFYLFAASLFTQNQFGKAFTVLEEFIKKNKFKVPNKIYLLLLKTGLRLLNAQSQKTVTNLYQEKYSSDNDLIVDKAIFFAEKSIENLKTKIPSENIQNLADDEKDLKNDEFSSTLCCTNYYYLGLLLQKKIELGKNDNKASAKLEERLIDIMLKINEHDPYNYYQKLFLGMKNIISKNATSALFFVKKALTMNTYDPRVYLFLSLTLSAAHKFDISNIVLNQGIKMSDFDVNQAFKQMQIDNANLTISPVSARNLKTVIMSLLLRIKLMEQELSKQKATQKQSQHQKSTKKATLESGILKVEDLFQTVELLKRIFLNSKAQFLNSLKNSQNSQEILLKTIENFKTNPKNATQTKETLVSEYFKLIKSESSKFLEATSSVSSSTTFFPILMWLDVFCSGFETLIKLTSNYSECMQRAFNLYRFIEENFRISDIIPTQATTTQSSSTTSLSSSFLNSFSFLSSDVIIPSKLKEMQNTVDSELFYMRGLVNEGTENEKEDLAKCLTLNPNHSKALVKLGLVHLQESDKFWKIQTQDDKKAPKANGIEDILKEYEDYSKGSGDFCSTQAFSALITAKSHLKTAVRVNPEEICGWYHLGQVLKKMNCLEEASDCFLTALKLENALPLITPNLFMLNLFEEE